MNSCKSGFNGNETFYFFPAFTFNINLNNGHFLNFLFLNLANNTVCTNIYPSESPSMSRRAFLRSWVGLSMCSARVSSVPNAKVSSLTTHLCCSFSSAENVCMKISLELSVKFAPV